MMIVGYCLLKIIVFGCFFRGAEVLFCGPVWVGEQVRRTYVDDPSKYVKVRHFIFSSVCNPRHRKNADKGVPHYCKWERPEYVDDLTCEVDKWSIGVATAIANNNWVDLVFIPPIDKFLQLMDIAFPLHSYVSYMLVWAVIAYGMYTIRSHNIYWHMITRGSAPSGRAMSFLKGFKLYSFLITGMYVALACFVSFMAYNFDDDNNSLISYRNALAGHSRVYMCIYQLYAALVFMMHPVAMGIVAAMISIDLMCLLLHSKDTKPTYDRILVIRTHLYLLIYLVGLRVFMWALHYYVGTTKLIDSVECVCVLMFLFLFGAGCTLLHIRKGIYRLVYDPETNTNSSQQ